MGNRWARRRCAALLVVALLGSLLATGPAVAASARATPLTDTVELTGSVVDVAVRRLPFAADHVALYWRGHPEAKVTVAFSRDGKRFGPAVDAGRDELGEQRANGITYGGVLATPGAIWLKVRTDTPLGRLTSLGVRDRVRKVYDDLQPSEPKPGASGPPQPAIISRAQWGADESLRFHADGTERWTPTFHPVQKLVVHHTAGVNNDRNPAATVRAIYHYHAVTQRWGDIGYNFLVDEAGRIYKGRHSHSGDSGADTITGENSARRGVTGAHAKDYNAGSVGVALLGTFSDRDATPAARRSLEDLLAWKAFRHNIDPQGTATYTSPISGRQRVFPNIAGHRDVGSTQCPGGVFYGTLPELRQRVAARTRA